MFDDDDEQIESEDIEFEKDNEEQEIPNDNINDDDDEEPQNEEEFDSRDTNDDNRFPLVYEGGWIESFHRNNQVIKYLVEVDSNFIKKRSNLKGLHIQQEYIQMFLSSSTVDPDDSDYLDNMQNIIEMYGQIHRRFIYTPKGLALVREKHLNGVYGQCPRVLCCKQLLLPVGLSEDMNYSRVRVFCPLCEEIYKPESKCKYIDGAYFGVGFPHAFLLTYPDLNPKNLNYKKYIPKVCGFRVFGKYGYKYYRKDKKEFEKIKNELGIENE